MGQPCLRWRQIFKSSIKPFLNKWFESTQYFFFATSISNVVYHVFQNVICPRIAKGVIDYGSAPQTQSKYDKLFFRPLRSQKRATVAKGYSGALVRRRSWVRFPPVAPLFHIVGHVSFSPFCNIHSIHFFESRFQFSFRVLEDIIILSW